MQCRSERWRPTSRHWTMSGSSPRCSQVQHTLLQKTGRRLSGRKDGHSGCSLASKCSRVWPCSLSLYHHRLLPRLPDRHGVGAVWAGLRHRDTKTETVRLWFDLRGWPEPTTGNLCTSYNAAGAGTNTARTVRTSFSAAARHVRAAGQGWSTEQPPRVHCLAPNSCLSGSFKENPDDFGLLEHSLAA